MNNTTPQLTGLDARNELEIAETSLSRGRHLLDVAETYRLAGAAPEAAEALVRESTASALLSIAQTNLLYLRRLLERDGVSGREALTPAVQTDALFEGIKQVRAERKAKKEIALDAVRP